MSDFGIVGLTASKIAQGMDYWRILVPLLHMAHLGYPVKVTRLGNDLPTFRGEAPYVLVLSEPFAQTHGDDRKTKKLCRKLQMLYVVDIADDPTPDGDSPMKRGAEAWGWKIECIVEADLVTCPTLALRDILLGYNDHVAVLPDLAEAAHWDIPRPKERPDNLTIGVRGGDTHRKDWAILEEPWLAIADKYPDVHFVSCGLEVDWMKRLPPDRYHHRPWALITGYQEQIKWIDIGCAPLDGAKFNQSKSPIAFYDFSLAGALTVASKGTIYDDPLTRSLSGSLLTADRWQEGLEWAINAPPNLRWLDAQAARQWVVQNRCMNERRCYERDQVYRQAWQETYGVEVANESDPILSNRA